MSKRALGPEFQDQLDRLAVLPDGVGLIWGAVALVKHKPMERPA